MWQGEARRGTLREMWIEMLCTLQRLLINDKGAIMSCQLESCMGKLEISCCCDGHHLTWLTLSDYLLEVNTVTKPFGSKQYHHMDEPCVLVLSMTKIRLAGEERFFFSSICFA